MWFFIFRLHEICYLNVKNNKSCDFFVFLVHGDISLNMNSTNVIFYISAAWNMLFKCEKQQVVWFFCIFGTWRYLVKYEFNKCDFLYFVHEICYLNVKNNKSCDFFVFLVHGDISLNMNSTNVIFYISSAWNMLFKCEKQQVVWFFCIFGTWRYLVKYEFNKCDFLYFCSMKYICYLYVKYNKSCVFFVFLVHGDISLNMNSTNVIFYISSAWNMLFKCEKQQVVWFFCIFGTWRYLVKYEFNKCDLLYFGCMKYVI